MTARLAGAAMLAFVLGCGTVPDIRFVGDAGAGADATADGGDTSDAGGDGAPNDASGACPLPAPAGAVCCATVWCVGNCAGTKCSECESKGCAGGEFCCSRNNVQCRAASLPCN